MPQHTVFEPTWESVRSHTLPPWYDECKLGVFIHWGLYSVPGWAEVTWELGEENVSGEQWFTHNPYAEWYQNSLRIPASPALAYHNKTYGADFPYERFAEQFTCERWNPGEWAALFREAGAGYVILTTKHHEGFCLYPSRYTTFNSVQQGPRRDLMGELTQAVREQGLKMGAYYSGLYDWTQHFQPKLTYCNETDYNHTYGFADYSYLQAQELVEQYHPSVLWNDIGWPEKGIGDLPHLFAEYYNTVPEGVVNDRWSNSWHDYSTKEYKSGEASLTRKWELCRGLGLSFGYNQNEDESTVLSPRGLVHLLAEVVSQGGNLLLNIGPRGDGSIPEIQTSRLRALGSWLKQNGDAIYGTTPWQERQRDTLENGAEVFYTRKGQTLFVILDGLPAGTSSVKLPVCDTSLPVKVEDEMPISLRLDGFFGG